MPVKFYIHTELPNDGKERLALYRTARALHNEYRHANDLYILIANLDRANNLTQTDLTQLDALLLGPRFIAILEFKNCFEPIVAADLNKPWYVDKGNGQRVMLGKRDRNPFQQVEDARRRWANFLQATAPDYLSSRRAQELEKAWLHLSACILFHPYLHRRSGFPPLGEASYWCHIGGIDEIVPFTHVMRSSILDFTAAEQLALADKVFFAHPWDEMEKSFQGILGYLRVWEGEQSTGRFPVFRHDQIIIGRSSIANGPHISHQADLVSGIHALIESDNERVCVRDLDSTNGTYLDNEQLRGETTKYLSAGKKLVLASSGSRGCQLRFEKVTKSRTSATVHKRHETLTE